MVDIDRVTLEKATRGDERAFRRLYDHYAPFVWRIVYRTAGSDRAAAEEIVQDTFVRVNGSLKKFNAASSLGTWIYRIAFNTAQSYLAAQARLRSKTVPFSDDLAEKRYPADAYDSRDLVEKILSELSPEERFLLITKEIDCLTFEEIAEITGKSQESLRTRVFRIKEKIKALFAPKPVPIEAII